MRKYSLLVLVLVSSILLSVPVLGENCQERITDYYLPAHIETSYSLSCALKLSKEVERIYTDSGNYECHITGGYCVLEHVEYRFFTKESEISVYPEVSSYYKSNYKVFKPGYKSDETEAMICRRLESNNFEKNSIESIDKTYSNAWLFFDTGVSYYPCMSVSGGWKEPEILQDGTKISFSTSIDGFYKDLTSLDRAHVCGSDTFYDTVKATMFVKYCCPDGWIPRQVGFVHPYRFECIPEKTCDKTTAGEKKTLNGVTYCCTGYSWEKYSNTLPEIKGDGIDNNCDGIVDGRSRSNTNLIESCKTNSDCGSGKCCTADPSLGSYKTDVGICIDKGIWKDNPKFICK